MRSHLPELILFRDYLKNKIECLDQQMNETSKVEDFNKVARVMQELVNIEIIFEALFRVKNEKVKR